ncbi:type VI secretion system contractile sheath small subunit [Marinomonas mediterranea]|jgi:type VI secretion protein, VC_A0107 family|uniref:Type VI secretion protein, VC_A0107 family n=1 Tax=Marinomonas mediterranea (strain ATCC 700492 / JCM 21426 / NBRC 103028 / MMB-1) TaxID=717774 RepID=F2JVZ5_MARM1|nr:type VI secretion system contractile sheath small subunit [Marinomonas mediterranea]ADZ92883.1 type VI secretion protein, VC_A0107 family [Marinomonas mediterranea MMB-1]WCN10816.1 type VI secretion system contractile sheath small subunit [Marinomonas mediterranea]WCN14873.1 type VI secretion system contractile sheath small subunit [Marinomonas mediterranea]WCN18905.1 type VI secretion system contractile sheath small subunit [Marinomonas mediterranea MMB-1]
MSDSFQSEIPRARVNIALDLDSGSGKKKKELPMKLLVMGDFSNGQSEGELSERERVNINGNNLEKVIANMAPKMEFAVPNRIKEGAGDIAVSLTAKRFDSFHPEQVAAQIPELSDLLSMRNLLKDLKSNLLDNATLRKEVERILNTQPDMDALKTELKALVEERSLETAEETQ